jgi:hypothetical protein
MGFAGQCPTLLKYGAIAFGRVKVGNAIANLMKKKLKVPGYFPCRE